MIDERLAARQLDVELTASHTMRKLDGQASLIGDLTTGKCKDSFAQVMNSAFPAGLLSVDQAVKMMNTACYKG